MEEPTQEKPAFKQILMWIALSMFPSIMLLATTNQMCQEVTVIPFLWVLPLSIYLISFIICFDNEKWYSRPIFGMLLLLGTFLTCLTIPKGFVVPIPIEVGNYAMTLFACCMTCHGELSKSKPATQHLTLFYLAVSLGGALGGVFVVVVAERLFTSYLELHIGLAGCLIMTFYAWRQADGFLSNPEESRPVWKILIGYLVLVVGFLIWEATYETGEVVDRSRNFYGILTIMKLEDPELGTYTAMRHGTINHGHQYDDPDKKDWKVCYFGEKSGLGLTILNHPLRKADKPMKVGVIGLGTGIIATYGRQGDTYRFYEINPDVITFAERDFTYLDDTPAKTEVVLGDARIVLERELEANGSQKFDLLIMDAFSSDSVPMHLLTRESFELYTAHLSENGMLAVNVSNNYLNLGPVVHRLGKEMDLSSGLFQFRPTVEDIGQLPNNWVILSQNEAFFEQPEIGERLIAWPETMPDLLWTDDFGSLWSILSFSH